MFFVGVRSRIGWLTKREQELVSKVTQNINGEGNGYPSCVTCEHFIVSDSYKQGDERYYTYARCGSPNGVEVVTLSGEAEAIALVRGTPLQVTKEVKFFCTNARSFEQHCGKRGKWWGPKR